ncbi:MAG: MFS transporter [Chloroflexi bacterium]|nr:MFS transporter [Chloroflexota bacterium]
MRWRRFARKWLSLGRDANLVLAYTLLKSLGSCAFTLFFNLYVLSLGYEADFVGLLMGLAAFPSIFLSMPVSFLSRRLGPRRSLVVSEVGVTAALAAVAFSTTPAALIATRTLLSCIMLLTDIATFPMVARCCAPEQRDTLFSANHSVMLFSGVLGNVVAGLLPALFAATWGLEAEGALAYRLTLLVGAALFGLSALPLLRVQPDRQAVTARYANPLRLMAKLPEWGKLILPQLIFSLGASLFFPFFNVYFKQNFGISDAMLGVVFAVAGLFTGITSLLAPLASEKWGQVRAIIVVTLASLPFMLAMGWTGSVVVAVAAYWFRGAICKMGDPLYHALLMNSVDEDERPLLNGLFTMSSRLAGTFMPYVSGLVQVRQGFGPLYTSAAILYAVATFTIYLYFYRGAGQRGGRTQGSPLPHAS